MSRIRTFVAIDVSAAIRSAAVRLINRLRRTGVDYNWVGEENLHLTLNFVGDLDDNEVPEFCRDVKRATESHPPFLLAIQGMGAFPESTRPRVVWAGVTDGSDELRSLNSAVAEVVYDWGIPKDKNRYQPHFTLGRVKRNTRWNPELIREIENGSGATLGSCMVEKVIVYSSHLDRLGPTYTPMATIRLLGPDADDRDRA